MFKKFGLAFVFAALFAFTASAQKIAYVDVNKILNTLPQYKEAQDQLDKIAATWRQEIAKDYDEIKGLYNRFQAEQVLLSDEQRKQREEEIMDKEKKVRAKQKQKFGPEGDLFERRKELVQPIQNRVYGGIETYANENGFDIIFDKGSNSGMIFSNPKFDKTDEILKAVSN